MFEATLAVLQVQPRRAPRGRRIAARDGVGDGVVLAPHGVHEVGTACLVGTRDAHAVAQVLGEEAEQQLELRVAGRLGDAVVKSQVLGHAVAPAAARTAMFEQMAPQHIEYMLSKIPMGRFVEPAEIAAMVCWLASEDCAFSTGAVFDLSGGRATY